MSRILQQGRARLCVQSCSNTNGALALSGRRMLHTSGPLFAQQVSQRPVSISPFQNRQKKLKAPLSTPHKGNNVSIYDFEDTVADPSQAKPLADADIRALSPTPLEFGWFTKKNDVEKSSEGERSDANADVGATGDIELRHDSYADLREINNLYRYAGRLCVYNKETVKFLEAIKGVLPKQYFQLFKEKATILRAETAAVATALKQSVDQNGGGRFLITGDAGVGKSVVLQQVAALAKEHAFVIHIPDAEDLVDGWVDFAYNESEKQYHQPMYTCRLLKRIHEANSLKLLREYTLNSSYTMDLGKDETFVFEADKHRLSSLVKFGAKNRRNASQAFAALMNELTCIRKDGKRIPVVFSVDNVSIFADNYFTAYRDAAYARIPYDKFYLPKLIISLLSGEVKLPGGCFVAATSSQTSNNLTMRRLKGVADPTPYTKPYKDKYDARLYEALQSAPKVDVKPFSLEETRQMVEYYGASGAIPNFEKARDDFIYGRSLIEREQHVLHSSRTRARFEKKLKQEEELFGQAASLTEAGVVQKDGKTLYSGLILAKVSKSRTEADGEAKRSRSDMTYEEINAEEQNEARALSFVDDVVKERTTEFGRRFSELKHISAAGVPRALTQSCLFPLQ